MIDRLEKPVSLWARQQVRPARESSTCAGAHERTHVRTGYNSTMGCVRD